MEDLSLEVEEGETVVLVGPSGCGKTTTMKMINRLVEPSSGRIYVDGKDVREQEPVGLRRRIGYVIQTVGLLPHRRVADNIGTVPELLGWPKPRIRERIDELAALFELDAELLGRYPRELSGGQRQRVGVARALAADPQVMLMDEPFAAVDPVVRARLQEQFLGIQRELHKTIVFITHDVDEAIKMADRIALLNVGGKLEQYASPMEVLSDPASEFVAGFVGAERGLKRLALVKVSEIALDPAPVVEVSAPVVEVRRQMDAAGSDWAGVVDGGKFCSLISRGRLGTVSSLENLPRGWGVVSESDSLRMALDAAVGAPDQVTAVLSDGGVYAGVLTPQSIGSFLNGSR